jgi:hypothetical protein
VTSNGNGFRAVGAIAPLEHTLPRHVHADAGDKPPKEVSSSAMSENAPSSRYISTADIGELFRAACSVSTSITSSERSSPYVAVA